MNPFTRESNRWCKDAGFGLQLKRAFLSESASRNLTVSLEESSTAQSRTGRRKYIILEQSNSYSSCGSGVPLPYLFTQSPFNVSACSPAVGCASGSAGKSQKQLLAAMLVRRQSLLLRELFWWTNPGRRSKNGALPNSLGRLDSGPV